MRRAFIETLEKLAEKDQNIYLLSGDLGFSVFERFTEKFPERFINCGIAEQNMMGVAAGLALEGKKPYVYSIVPFVTMRCFEQIRNDIAYQNLNVKIIGMGAGFSYGAQDYTHYGIEDVSILRVLPNISILSPADPAEAKELIMQSYKKNCPAYIRLGKSSSLVLTGVPKVKLGKPLVVKNGGSGVIIATGSCVETGINVAKRLENDGYSLKVISMHTIKPIDEKLLIKEIQGQKIIFTIEEHSLVGGLSSVVAEILFKNNVKNLALESFGVPIDYRNQVGSRNFLKKRYGIDEASVYKKIAGSLKNNGK